MLNMFNPLGPCSIRMCLEQGKCSICSKCSIPEGETFHVGPRPSFPPRIEHIEFIEHFLFFFFCTGLNLSQSDCLNFMLLLRRFVLFFAGVCTLSSVLSGAWGALLLAVLQQCVLVVEWCGAALSTLSYLLFAFAACLLYVLDASGCVLQCVRRGGMTA